MPAAPECLDREYGDAATMVWGLCGQAAVGRLSGKPDIGPFDSFRPLATVSRTVLLPQKLPLTTPPLRPQHLSVASRALGIR